MAQVELIMPKMGESIMEATILKWVKNVGDSVEEDETILEIATDKVDSEIPSPVAGTIAEIFFKEDDVVEVGKVIATIATGGEEVAPARKPSMESPEPAQGSNGSTTPAPEPSPDTRPATADSPVTGVVDIPRKSAATDRFYSPLVRKIAETEGIPVEELDQVPGTGMKGRVTKKDILNYVEKRSGGRIQDIERVVPETTAETSSPVEPSSTVAPASGTVDEVVSGDVEIIEMDRMRRLIADHMVKSKHTSPHVTSFVEVDVTNIVNWRNSVKGTFQEKYGQKITFTPIFVEAVVKALGDFPMVNISVDGARIIRKKRINVGMATALPSGNLIVPVIHDADSYNLIGLAKKVNDLALRARKNKLLPEEIQDGTFTLTNVGTFGNVMGTPIINQPQVAILATGAIRKKPAVVETEFGDLIAVRHMMFLSLSYDHRVVDGILGGSFLRRIADYLEDFDNSQVL